MAKETVRIIIRNVPWDKIKEVFKKTAGEQDLGVPSEVVPDMVLDFEKMSPGSVIDIMSTALGEFHKKDMFKNSDKK